MIIRKPYAFLIKYFKFIHLLILIFSSYVLFRSNRLFSFFSDYARTRQIISTTDVSNIYITPLMLIFSGLIILFSIIIFILLVQKDKPKMLYVLMIIYYIGFIIFCIISTINIKTIQLEGIDPQSARIIRDISLAVFLIQIIFVLQISIRTLGFDIRKFHFGEDLQALKIEVTDSEEIELTTGIDTDKLMRKLLMTKEELKAFFFENKAIIIILLIILILIIPSVFILKNSIKNKIYSENEIINLNNFNLMILDSYITKYDYSGNKKLKNSSYLIVKFNISNLGDKERGITLNNLRLEINNDIYMSNTTYYSYFIDLGNGYYSQTLKNGESKSYIAVFVVSDSLLEDDLIIRYTDSLIYNKSEVKADYKRINIDPVSLDNIREDNPVNLGDEMNFSDSSLRNTTLSISNYGIQDEYSYTYNEKIKYIINQNGLVLKLSYKFNLDQDVTFIEDINDFISKYCSLLYTYNKKEYSEIINDITPRTYTSKDMFLAINENVKSSASIKLMCNIRNIKYIYVLKQ